MANNKSGLYNIIKAAGKRKENELKDQNALRLAVMKARIDADKQVNVAGRKQQMKQQEIGADKEYLYRRLKAENPFANFELPTDENPQVEFPASKLDMSPSGKVTERPLKEREKQVGFMTAYTKAVEQGKPVSEVATKIYEKYYKEVNKLKKPEEDVFEKFQEISGEKTKIPRESILTKIGNLFYRKVKGGWQINEEKRATG